jgi:hypothetical protein
MNPTFNQSGTSVGDYEFSFEYYLDYSNSIQADVSLHGRDAWSICLTRA